MSSHASFAGPPRRSSRPHATMQPAAWARPASNAASYASPAPAHLMPSIPEDTRVQAISYRKRCGWQQASSRSVKQPRRPCPKIGTVVFCHFTPPNPGLSELGSFQWSCGPMSAELSTPCNDKAPSSRHCSLAPCHQGFPSTIAHPHSALSITGRDEEMKSSTHFSGRKRQQYVSIIFS